MARGSLAGARRLAQTVPNLSSSDSSLVSLDWAAEEGTGQASKQSPRVNATQAGTTWLAYPNWQCRPDPGNACQRHHPAWPCQRPSVYCPKVPGSVVMQVSPGKAEA